MDIVFWVINYKVYMDLIDKMVYMEQKGQKPTQVLKLFRSENRGHYDDPQLAVENYMVSLGADASIGVKRVEDVPEWSVLHDEDQFRQATGFEFHSSDISISPLLEVFQKDVEPVEMKEAEVA